MFDFRSARAVQTEKPRQADVKGAPNRRGNTKSVISWKRATLAVAVCVLAVSLLAMSSSVSTSGSVHDLSDATTSEAPAVEEHFQSEDRADGSPWWEGRTWAGEIDVCVTATDDEPGCQWLAGLLIHRRCELKMYQTFAAALFVGAPFDALYQDAVDRGECQDLQGVSSTEASSRLGQSAPNEQSGGAAVSESR